MENPDPSWEEGLEESQVHFHQLNTINYQDQDQEWKDVRLLAQETEAKFYFKTMNLNTLRLLVWIQSSCSIIVFVSQVLLYAISTGRFKFLDVIGMGIWAPLSFFTVATGLTWMIIKSPSGCSIGVAIGFQIASAFSALILTFLSVLSIMFHGTYNYRQGYYDFEVSGRIFTSFMIVSSALICVSSIFVAVHLCRSVCCGQQRLLLNTTFDIVSTKLTNI